MALLLKRPIVPFTINAVASCLFIAVNIVLLCMHLATSVNAETSSWESIQTPKITWENTSISGSLRPDACQTDDKAKVYLYGSLRNISTCPIQVGPLALTNYVAYINYNNYWSSAVKFPGDSRYYDVNIPYSPGRYIAIPNSNNMIEYSYDTIKIHEDVPAHLTKLDSMTSGQNEYSYQPNILYTYKRSPGATAANGMPRAVSPNGKWLTFFDAGVGIIRLNLQTFEALRLTNPLWANGNFLIDVANDGQVIFYDGNGYMNLLVIDGKNCGSQDFSSDENLNLCPMFDAGSYITSYTSELGRLWQIDVAISDDGHGVQFKACTTTDPITCKIYNLNNLSASTTYSQADQLNYLALGDSISSGEGDIEKNPVTNKKYYRNFTDVEEDKTNLIPREKCHLSTRSYPYRLASSMELSNTQWASVACSNAKSSDIYQSTNSSYSGQAKGGATLFSNDGKVPRLQDYSNRIDLQSNALNEFIPGRNAQIEFVKTYKPKVITITSGANDIDFSEMLKGCVNPLPTPTTCEWADSGKQRLAKLMQGRYDDLVSLYRELHENSRAQTRIYVLGYPQIISDNEPGSCKGNVGSLNLKERQMMVDATNYLNKVIEHAANAAGVKYIDISHALDGHKLCEGDNAYMNGIVDFLGIVNSNNVDLESQESFHPNSLGQTHIALAVEAATNYEDMQSYDICPETTESPDDTLCPKSGVIAEKPPITDFDGVQSDEQIRSENKEVMDSVAKKNSEQIVTLDQYTVKPNSTVNITIHSDPTDLGNYAVASDGSLNQSITIPSTVPAGYHTIIINGQTYSGEPIEISQTVLVIGTNPTDLDDNGVNDTQQPCGPFLQASGQDVDLDGIDDSCDPNITSAPELYRLRQGDPRRNYNGSAEHDNYLYVERNTRAKSITGINGDYDPDGDGWSIVGASQGIPFSKSSVPDTAPAANFEVKSTGVNARPYIYIRAGGYGCTSFTPTSLKKVQSGQSRTIKKAAFNTDKCRREAPNDDVDGNGLPDNVQPLYEAHQGSIAKGEDPSRIYLYRNFYSAEAQLGISDYSPTGTPAGNATQPIQSWNLLASSKPNEYIPSFNKLVILEDSNGKPLPIILTKKLNGKCVAYQPSNTNIIKMTTQSTRYLKKLTALPGGVSCE